jgi:hypothetical protein
MTRAQTYHDTKERLRVLSVLLIMQPKDLSAAPAVWCRGENIK